MQIEGFLTQNTMFTPFTLFIRPAKIFIRRLVSRKRESKPVREAGIKDAHAPRKKGRRNWRPPEEPPCSLSSQLLTAQETERRKISKELHDELGQALAALKLRLGMIHKKLPLDQPALLEECAETARYIDQVMENVRRLSRDLSPSVLEDLGLSTALKWEVAEFQRLHPAQVSLEILNLDAVFPPQVQIAIFRILEETLANIGKHARASQVLIRAALEKDGFSLLVEDEGQGFPLDQPGWQSKGLGIAVMKERARMVGGDLRVESQEGHGTRVVLRIPAEKLAPGEIR